MRLVSQKALLQSFPPRAEIVLQQVMSKRRFILKIIELNRLAHAGKGLVAVPAIFGDAENQSGSQQWGNFRYIVFQIMVVGQDPEAAAGRIPLRIEVQEQ